MLMPVVIAGAPQVKAVQFTAATDMITAASVTGLADGPSGTFSAWVKINGSDSTNQFLLQLGANFNIRRNSTLDGTVARRRKLIISAFSAAAATRISYVGGTDLTIGSWVHVLLSWDTTTSARHFYYSDVADTPITNTIAAGDIDYTGANNGVGQNQVPAASLDADVAEVWFNPTYLDLSVEANRRKFIKASGKPEFLGLTGQRPTGASPLLYFKGPASNWGTNSGTGGNFTVTGTFTDTTPPP